MLVPSLVKMLPHANILDIDYILGSREFSNILYYIDLYIIVYHEL